jgi:hypothetical protein
VTDEQLLARAVVIAAGTWDENPPPPSLHSAHPEALAFYIALRYATKLPAEDRNVTEELAMLATLMERHLDFCQHPEVKALIANWHN